MAGTPGGGTPVDDLFGRWNKRSALLRSQGVSPDKYVPIFKQDYQNVLKGGQPLSDTEAQFHFRRAYTGESILGDPERRTGVRGVIENIPKDIGEIAGGLTKLPGALAKEAKDTAIFAAHSAGPAGGLLGDKLGIEFFSRAKQANALAQAMGYKDAEDMRANDPNLQGDISTGDIFRTFTKAPFIRLAPGSYTAGSLTSPEGRKDLQQHPVQVLLDLLPFAGKAGKVATAGKTALPGSATEALQRGRPIKALSRTIPAGAPDELGVRPTISDQLKKAAKTIGVSSEQRGISQAASVENRELGRTRDLIDDATRKDFEELGITTEEQFADLATKYQSRTLDSTYDDTTKKAFDLFQKATDDIVRQSDELHYDPSGEIRSELNPREKPIIDLIKRKSKLEERIAKFDDALGIEFGSEADEAFGPYRVTKKGNKSKQREGESATQYRMRTSEAYRARYEALRAKAVEQLAKLEDGSDDLMAKVPPARFIPKVNDMARQMFIEYARTNLPAEQAAKTVADVQAKLDPLKATPLLDEAGEVIDDVAIDGIPDKVIRSIIRDANRSWSTLRSEGLDPGYLPAVTRGRAVRLENPRIAYSRNYTPAYEKGRATLGASAIDNARLSLVSAATEKATQAHTQRFLGYLTQNHLIKGDDLLPQLRERTRAFMAAHPGADPRAFEETRLLERYRKFDPAEYGLTAAFPGGEFYIEKSLARTLEQLAFNEPSVIGKASNKVQGVFKRAVLFQPSFLFNNVVGNMMFALMEADSPITAFKDAFSGYKALRSGKLPSELRQGVNQLDWTPPQQFRFETGSKVSNLLRNSWLSRGASTLERKWFGVNSAIDDFYRAWAYMQDYRKSGDVNQAMEFARQVYSNMDDLTPIERNLIKQVIPFYSFQRHLFRFAARYPADHPIRTVVIQSAIRQHQEEKDLPSRFKQMFWLGEPNADGEQWRINLRSLNPFSDFGDNFTLAGFLNNSTPLIKAPAEAFGISDLTAAPGYTPRQYNPESGRYESGRDFSTRKFVGNFLPFVEKGYEFVDPDQGRYIPARENNLLRGATSIFNIPLLPRITNVDRERFLSEKARLSDVTNAIQSAQAGRGDEQLRRYPGLVPFRGQLVPADVLADALAGYAEQLEAQGLEGAPVAHTPRR